MADGTECLRFHCINFRALAIITAFTTSSKYEETRKWVQEATTESLKKLEAKTSYLLWGIFNRPKHVLSGDVADMLGKYV